ncbi:MAG TPA: tetratricopeptide repeat protein [Casimicrobiaceae bacterium]|nr:tetratricopeptide repeat protein [Casimicrobiaceae bacterium]
MARGIPFPEWLAAVALASALVPALAMAVPFVPASDAVVLESLPEKGDPALAALRRLRRDLAANPQDQALARSVAQRALEAARTLGDPRFLGQAQAALAPWWGVDDIPAPVLLLRATIRQSQHDFAGALTDLDRLLAAHPGFSQARLTRAILLTVVGRYADARRDCAALTGRASPLAIAACDAGPASLSGDADAAYDALLTAPLRASDDAAVREWALTIAAEIAARRGHYARAEAHFRSALALDPRDAYLKAAYADFLLDRGRAREVVTLLRDDTRNDGLLLRLALAEARLPDARPSYEAHRADLAARFDAARQRGDSLHRREEARFRLDLLDDSETALALARANWLVQREPADLRILLDAARASSR